MNRALINPFIYIAGFKALAIGLAIILATGLAAFLTGTNFDGIFDIHFGGSEPMYVCLLMGLMNWLVVVFVLGVASVLLSNTRFRIVDLLGTQAMARMPFLLATLIPLIYDPDNIMGLLAGNSLSSVDVLGLAFTGLIVLLVIIWVITWTYQAYTHIANIKGTRAVVSFIIAMIVATVIDKILLSTIFGITIWPAQAV